MIRTLLFLLILLLIIISVGGYIGVSLNLLPDDVTEFYNKHFSFFTGLASVIGLLAFASSNKIKSTDFEIEELEKFKNLIHTAEELEKIEESKYKTTKELKNLELKKKAMEVSIKKAGAVLFYTDQKNRNEKIILEKIESDETLVIALSEFNKSTARLEALNQEIKMDENVEIIVQILKENDYNPNDKLEFNNPLLDDIYTVVSKISSFIRI